MSEPVDAAPERKLQAPDQAPPTRTLAELAQQAAGEARAEEPATPPADAQPAKTLEDLGVELKQVEVDKKRSDLDIGRSYARVLLGALAVQIAIADAAFYVYGFYNAWNIPVSAIQVWLAATVIEVIGVVAVITRSLFPSVTGDG